MLLWTALSFLYSTQSSRPSSAETHRCSPVGGFSEGDIGTDENATWETEHTRCREQELTDESCMDVP